MPSPTPCSHASASAGSHTLPELLETLKLLHVAGPLASNFDLVDELLRRRGLADGRCRRRPQTVDFRALKTEQLPPLRESLGEMVTLSNPLDYHTFVWGDLDKQTEAFTAMMKGDYALNLDRPRFPARRPLRCVGLDDDGRRGHRRGQGDRRRLPASWRPLPENMPEDDRRSLMADGVVAFCGIDETIAAAEVAAGIGAAWQCRASRAAARRALPSTARSRRSTEAEAKAELPPSALPCRRAQLASTPDEAAEQAERLGFPVVLKGARRRPQDRSRRRRSSTSGIVEAVRTRQTAMTASHAGYLVEKMIDPPVAELIVGALRDPVPDWSLTIGAGGILVELLEDSVILTLPTTKKRHSARQFPA